MILQALTSLFEDLVGRGKIEGQGWSKQKISFILCIDENGALEQVLPNFEVIKKKGKDVLIPKEVNLPAPVRKASSISSNFLWENSGYMLGIVNVSQEQDEKGKKRRLERAKECFLACKELHHKLLEDVSSPVAEALLRFFDNREAGDISDIPKDLREQVIGGGNLMFRVNGIWPMDDPGIRTSWQTHSDAAGGSEKMQCLVTGRIEVPARVHPAIKGVKDAQSSGASLVSFNNPALCSYEKGQNLNAPVGEQTAFAYTAALNYLLADRDNVHLIGNTTVVSWAEGADVEYQEFLGAALFGEDTSLPITQDILRDEVRRLAEGLPCKDLSLDPSRQFYVLGIGPNAGRLSVRFFLKDNFGDFIRNVSEHYNRLEIVKSGTDSYETLPIWALLRETVNTNSEDKNPSPAMANAVMRSVLQDLRYPASLLESVMLRIHSERAVTRGRAAIIKAYYLKNSNAKCPREVLTVASATIYCPILHKGFSIQIISINQT